MLSPLAVARGLVVYPREEVELVQRHLFFLDAQLVVQLALRRPLDAHDGVGQVRARLGRHAQRVRAARIGPHVGERDLLRRALLEEQLVLVVEEEYGEGPVQQPLVDVRHEMACGASVCVCVQSISLCSLRHVAWPELPSRVPEKKENAERTRRRPRRLRME